MAEWAWQVVFVAGLALVVLIAVFRMRSPSRGGGAMQTGLEELESALRPEVKRIRETKETSRRENDVQRKGDADPKI